MTDDELKRLKDLPVPEPRPKAKAAALAAALAAFDASAEKNAAAPKGSAAPVRLTHASSQPKRRGLMRVTPVHYRIAASVTALMIATPLAYYMYQEKKEADYRTAEPLLSSSEAPKPEIGAAGQKPFGRNKQILEQFGGDVEPGSTPTSTLDGRIETALRDDGKSKESRESSALNQPHAVRTINIQPDGTPAAPVLAKPRAASERLVARSAPPPPAEEAKTDASRRSQVVAMNEQAPFANTPVAAKSEGRVDEAGTADEYNQEDRDQFDATASNPVKQVAAEPVSTFSVDVDTASYAFVRRTLNSGNLPPKDAVRVEEMINYFPYAYPRPDKAEAPFQPTVTVMPAPWNTSHKLLHIGIKGYDLTATARPRANLVFLIDVSGSMEPADRLPLVKNAFRMLVDELKPDDTVGIVTYASGSGVALEPTKIANKAKILAAIDKLGAGGSTAGAQGVQDAYQLAESNFDKAAVNRIVLATDGDFNVGITDPMELQRFVERKRQSGIFLSILGVGQGNYNDALMQKLAQNGNGTAAYVDTLNEARKVLVDEASSTLFTIAKDVKIQVEFNPTQVSEYRLIGYETRALKREDFNNDKVDAGDIGSGHTVTAIYEITPVGAPKFVDDLRYQKPEDKPAASGSGGELGFLKLRYKLPNEETSKLITQTITKELEKPSVDAAPEDVRFSVAVAAFGQLLRGQPYLQNYSYDDVIALARGARGADNFGYRSEFANLVRIAKSVRP